jgi:CMP-N-acetylneuraminic acid synthetase
MKIVKNSAWGIITARGGSKSIPLKNIVPVCGKPLLQYIVNAAKHAKFIDRIICSTDHPDIESMCHQSRVEVIKRPKELSGDLVRSDDVMIHAAESAKTIDGSVAEVLVLLQPTSIFLKGSQIDEAVAALFDNPIANSSQTVVTVPHQFHAINQRKLFEDGTDIGFVYPEERKRSFNKQTKPIYYAFGNLIAMRTEALIQYRSMYARPSVPIQIPFACSYDLDSWGDIELAELMIKNRLVDLD